MKKQGMNCELAVSKSMNKIAVGKVDGIIGIGNL